MLFLKIHCIELKKTGSCGKYFNTVLNSTLIPLAVKLKLTLSHDEEEFEAALLSTFDTDATEVVCSFGDGKLYEEFMAEHGTSELKHHPRPQLFIAPVDPDFCSDDE
jgi:hypothetical protein